MSDDELLEARIRELEDPAHQGAAFTRDMLVKLGVLGVAFPVLFLILARVLLT